ncbi:AfsR/SARP family transcriptional regulator [Embleya sp. NPDC055664]
MIPRFGVLGDIEARMDGAPLDLGHIRQRCVPAVLLVEANRVVPIESVVERVWGHDCPDRARHTLYSYVSRLRRRLRATQARIARRSGGYLLETDTSVVDLHRFRDPAARGRRADDDHGAASHWARSLDLWRGDAFADGHHPLTAGRLESITATRKDGRVTLGRRTPTPEVDVIARVKRRIVLGVASIALGGGVVTGAAAQLAKMIVPGAA